MLCVSIPGPDLRAVRAQLVAAQQVADLVELRLDLYRDVDDSAIEALQRESSLPMLLTLRKASHGGAFSGSEAERVARLRRLAALKPRYLDLEADTDPELFHELSRRYPEISVLCSHHDFSGTPRDFDLIYKAMKKVPAALYKLAFTASHVTDALRLLCWAKGAGTDIIAISMGQSGKLSRIVGKVFGSRITYASLDGEVGTAPGQVSASELLSLYRFSSMDSSTQVFGLIGGSVDNHVSHLKHNALMAAAGLNACYVMLSVKPGELESFLHYARELSFAGLSVTMPLKEVILPYLDQVSDEALQIGAVNTLVIRNGHIAGYNTDSFGALDALEKTVSINGKRVVLIGAGGAAKAIAYEAVKRGAQLFILNRHPDKALELSQRLGCFGGGLEEMGRIVQEGYDVIIDSTPASLPIDPALLLPGTVLMDVKWPHEGPLALAARAKGCRVVTGTEMFFQQLVGQYRLWFGESISKQVNHLL